jgi:hypothetical protein
MRLPSQIQRIPSHKSKLAAEHRSKSSQMQASISTEVCLLCVPIPETSNAPFHLECRCFAESFYDDCDDPIVRRVQMRGSKGVDIRTEQVVHLFINPHVDWTFLKWKTHFARVGAQ